MLSSLHPRALVVPSEVSSVKAVVSTPPLPSSRMLLARLRRRLLLSVSQLVQDISTRPLSRRRFGLISMASVVA